MPGTWCPRGRGRGSRTAWQICRRFPRSYWPVSRGLPKDFSARRARQAYDYFRGRRVNSWAAFDELLRQVLDEARQIQLGRNWDDDIAPLAAIDRQLRAACGAGRPTGTPRRLDRRARQRAFTLGGRFARLRRAGSDAGVGPGAIADLSNTFWWVLRKNPAQALFQRPASIASEEEFSLLLDETQRDCRSLSGRTADGKAAPYKGQQVVWDETGQKKLDPIRRMVEKGYVPTQRERGEIHRALTSIDGSGGGAKSNPCPAIHDFLADITHRLRRIDDYYAWLVTAGQICRQGDRQCRRQRSALRDARRRNARGLRPHHRRRSGALRVRERKDRHV